MNAILQVARLLVIGFSVILGTLVLWLPPTHTRSSPDPFSRETAEAQIPDSGRHMQQKGDVFVASTKIVVDRKKEAIEVCSIVFIAGVILRAIRGRSPAPRIAVR